MKRNSLRVRMITLYATVVTVIVAAAGPSVGYIYWRNLLSRVDDELETQAAVVAQSLLPISADAFDLNLPVSSLEYFENEPYYGIWTSDRRPVDISDPGQVPDLPESVGLRSHDGRREAVIRTPDGVTVLVGRDMAGIREAVSSLALTMAGVGLAASVFAIFCGWLLAERALAPIARINRTARAMAEGDLSARIPVEGTETELEQVVLALNSAFDRMQEAFEQLRRFTADASHELRTPAATLSAETEWALSKPRDAEAYRDSLVTCRTAALRIGGVVQGLLLLARADAGESPLVRRLVRVDAVVDDVVALARPLALQKNVQIVATVAPFELLADLDRLREAISNLVVNAVHFNRQDGEVRITGRVEAAQYVLSVQDTGIGIAPAHLAHVFERFYRVEPSRGGPGAGLGLAIAKSIIEQHGGTLRGRSEVDRGSEFVVELPISQANV